MFIRFKKTSPLEQAILDDDATMIATLIKQGIDIDARIKTKTKETIAPITLAAISKKNNAAVALLKAGAKWKIQDKLKQHGEYTSLFLLSASHLNSTMVAELLKLGAEVDERTPADTTALMYAANMADIEIMKILLAANADPNLISGPEKENETAVHYLLISDKYTLEGKIAALQLLIDNGADLNQCGIAGYLHTCAIMGNADGIRAMHHFGHHCNTTTGDAITPLLSAVCEGHADCVQALLDCGARLETDPMECQMLLLFASKDIAILRLILQARPSQDVVWNVMHMLKDTPVYDLLKEYYYSQKVLADNH